MPREIALSKGKVALVDDGDWARIARYHWWPARGVRTWYGLRTQERQGRITRILMHHAVLGLPGSVQIDHRNGNGLDNRRENLRRCTQSQNQQNSAKQEGRSSRFKGVCWSRKVGKWVAYIKLDRRQRHLGTFDQETAAARAYDAAAKELFGEFARPNFPSESAK